MGTKQAGLMMLAAGCVMILTSLITGAMSNTASDRWLFIVLGVSGLIVAICGDVLRRRNHRPGS